MSSIFGMTEAGDPAFDDSWMPWVNAGNPTILITKQFPRIYAQFGDGLLRKKVIVHATITGGGGTVFEPGVPDPNETIEALKSVQIEFHKKFVIRIDPLTPLLEFLDRSLKIFLLLEEAGFSRFRLSVLDYYRHVRERAKSIGFDFQHRLDQVYYGDLGFQSWMSDNSQIHLPLSERIRIIDAFKKSKKKRSTSIEVCGEAGINCDGCLSERDYEILGVPLPEIIIRNAQHRLGCQCIGQKKELLKKNMKPCPGSCFYCYWI